MTRKERRKDVQWLLGDYLSTHPCASCGGTDIRTLEFHHLDPADKSAGVGRMVNRFYNLKAILLEIAKCEILCKNCHAIKTCEEHPDGDWRTEYLRSKA